MSMYWSLSEFNLLNTKKMKQNLLHAALLFVCCAFTACEMEIPTYTFQVSGTVVDTKGVPVASATVKVVDRQKNQNDMFGPVSSSYIERVVGSTTTDEDGHYSLSITSEGVYFDVSVIRREQTWDYSWAQSGSARCECEAGKSNYVQDILAKTETEYYTGDLWQRAVEATPLVVNLADSIHILLKDGGTIQSAGIWFDNPSGNNENNATYTRHDFKSDYYMCYLVDGGDFSIAAGLTEYDLIFKMDTTNISHCNIPYSERCYLKVASIKKNNDMDSYFIPLSIK